MRRGLWMLLAGCAGGETDDDRAAPPVEETGSTGDTGDTGEVPVAPPVCVLAADNALRADCLVEVPTAQQVEISYARLDGLGPTRTHGTGEVATTHAVALYFLEAGTAYRYTVRALADGTEWSGTFVTGDLPEGADVRLSSTGTPTTPYVGVASPCATGAYAVIVDTSTGRTVWYHNFTAGPYGFMDAASFTEDRTVLTLTDGQVIEADLTGRERLRLELGAELQERVHHDAFRRDGLTWVLFQETVEDGEGAWLLDGFYVFDATEALLGEWHLTDWFTPLSAGSTPFPEDTSHANAIWVDEDGTTLFSMRHLSAIAAIQGDPAQPGFGDLLWRMSNPTSEFGTDFTYTVSESGPADFERQHNVSLLPDGRMLLLDNRADVSEPSRAVELSFDVPSGSAVFEQEFVLPSHCDYQGGAMRTSAGNTLATCAQQRRAYEFDPTGELVWETEAVCQTGLGMYIPRFVPLDW